jgi:predicted Zn-dependent protease with MMP-like domain
MTDKIDWERISVPDLAAFEEMAQVAWARLPEEFRKPAGNLIIRIEDFAIDEVLDALGIEDPFDLLGLYQGVSLDKKSVLDSAQQPDMVFLYRRPLLDEWADSGETLGDLITHVLIHEVGHHFGFSDDDMERIEAGVGGAPG